MLSSLFLRVAISILGLSIVTRQVDIRIERTWIIAGEPESFIAATCFNIPPGECCKPPMHDPAATIKVLFRRLLAWDIAAVWQDRNRLESGSSRHETTGCSGPLLASRPGPGTWLWRQPSESSIGRHAAQGASYIRLPSILPPDPRVAYSLIMEGVLCLVWNSGIWFANNAAEKLLRERHSIHASEKASRDIRSASRGNVYSQPPNKFRYPDSLEIDSIVYAANKAGNFLYLDKDGNLLNLTDWFLRAGD